MALLLEPLPHETSYPIENPAAMSDLFGQAADSTRYDIDFSVPQVHRLRFTRDCFGEDFPSLVELLPPSSHGLARVQVWIDQGLVDWMPTLPELVATRLDSSPGVELVGQVSTLPGGEAVKNDVTYVEQLLTAFNRHELDRRSYVLAIGGGAVLDTVGYAASIAHRGIRLIRIPTTTLAQADSGVGVKNAVNWFGKKNWKGTFATPWGVINDERLLDGLGDRDFCCGFSEAVKVALLKDRDFFDFLSASAESIANRTQPQTRQAVRQSVLLHLWHITRGGDPFESREARPLDFGHWSAHKLEAITNYSVRHGEAVAIGVAVDVAYSHLRHGLSAEIVERTLSTLQGLRQPIWHAALCEDVIFDGLEEFRQHLGGELTITLIEDVGRPLDVHTIDRTAMQEAIALVASHARAASQECQSR